MSADVFDQTLLFKNLDARQSDLVRPLFYPCSFCAGAPIFTQGDESDYLYLLVKGEVIVRYKPEDGPALTVARIRPGGVVGWSAALGTPAYGSDAICESECQMLRVRGADLRTLYREDPETGTIVLELLANAITRRLQNTHEQVVSLLKQGLRLTCVVSEVTNPLS